MNNFLDNYLNQCGIEGFSFITESVKPFIENGELSKIIKSLPEEEKKIAIQNAIELMEKLRKLASTDEFKALRDELKPWSGQGGEAPSQDEQPVESEQENQNELT